MFKVDGEERQRAAPTGRYTVIDTSRVWRLWAGRVVYKTQMTFTESSRSCQRSTSARCGAHRSSTAFQLREGGRTQESDLFEGCDDIARSSKRSDAGTRTEMQPDEFREIGHRLVDQIAVDCRRCRTAGAPDESPATSEAFGAEQTLPPAGTDAAWLVIEATELLFDHSLFNGHPRFSATHIEPAPIGCSAISAPLNQT